MLRRPNRTDRRAILGSLLGGGVAVAVAPRLAWARDRRAQRVVAASAHAPAAEVPEGKRIPFGWPAFAVPLRTGFAEVSWPAVKAPPARTHARFRATVALDVREEKRVELWVGDEVVGELDVRYSPYLQVLETPLPFAAAARALRDGLRLVVRTGGEPLWLFSPDGARMREAMSPHLLFSSSQTGSWKNFEEAFLSLASVQPFGWMEGCVLEGLVDLERKLGRRRVRPALDAHLGLFVDAEGRLSYESPRSAPVEDAVAGIEQGLPFAAIARLHPSHPRLETFLTFCRDHTRDGIIEDHGTTSTEGGYTIAYPLARLGVQRKDPELVRLALLQLRHRRARLTGDGWIAQARSGPGDEPKLRNWARGVTWYLLGLARTLSEVGPGSDTADLREELRRAASWAAGFQQTSGLWPCFIDDPTSGIDSSGSAGIAGALAFAARAGLIPSAFGRPARRAHAALPSHFTPDGLLAGAAQSNRAGEALQRGDFRVIFQMGMGLAAQLHAALD